MNRNRQGCSARDLVVTVAVLVCAGVVQAQDLTVCQGVDPCDAPRGPVCDGRGFQLELKSFAPASTSDSGAAMYTYEICSPAAGTCAGDSTKSCLDNSQCIHPRQGDQGPCNRTCAVDEFRELSHADIGLPALLGGTCVPAGTEITIGCHTPNQGAYPGVLGDGSCFTGTTPVAKCDETDLDPGECLTMTIGIPGENNLPGLGAAIVLSKAATSCETTCLAGPSCDTCSPPPGGACLTRTIGFWGNHPWVANDFDPVTVCGKTLACSGPPDGKSNPSCTAGLCDSLVEGLCSTGGEDRTNPQYIQLVRQLTAAKLNLAASAALVDGDCSDFSYNGKSIAEWIALCETKCGNSGRVISNSECIEALDAFNNSQDVGFDQTPEPFNSPGIDDYGNTSGADPTQCTRAHGTGGNTPLVIGKKVKGGANCQ